MRGILKLLQGRWRGKGVNIWRECRWEGMDGWGEGEERAAALGTGVPRMAESAFWLVGQCVCALRSCSTIASMFVSLQLREFKFSV